MIDLMTFIFLNFLGVISPGPDFAIVTHYGLNGSRKSALLSSLGIGAALLIHVFYCVSGVAVFLQSSPHILNSIKILASLYLGYLGFKMFRQSKSHSTILKNHGWQNPFVAGFLTNLLNLKATVFLLSLFSLFAHSMDSMGMKMAFALSIPLIAVGWFSFLSYFLTHPRFLPFLQEHRKKFMSIMSLMLLFLSVYGVLSAIKSVILN